MEHWQPNPTNDPERPIRQAANLSLVLGVLCLVFGAFGVFAVVPEVAQAPSAGETIFSLLMIGGLLVSGVLYVVCASKIRGRRLWAVIVALILAGLHALLMVLSVIGQFLKEEKSPSSLVLAGVILMLAVLLIVDAVQSFGPISQGGAGGQDSFAPPAPTGPFRGYPPATPPPLPPQGYRSPTGPDTKH